MITIKTACRAIAIAALILTITGNAYALPWLNDVNNTTDYIAGGNVALAPESGILLLIGSGLMGIALYRKLRNK